MIKKISIVIGIYIVSLFIGVFSCNIIKPCGPFPDKFKVVGFEYQILKAKSSEVNGIQLEEFKINVDTLNYIDFALFMRSQKENYFSMLNRVKSFSLIQPIYACSPIAPISDERIEKIEVFCDKDWNPDYLAGTDLGPIIEVVVYDQINGIYNDSFDLQTFVATEPNAVDQMTLFLKLPPAVSGKFTFTVKYYQDGIDEDLIEFETSEVLIKAEKPL